MRQEDLEAGLLLVSMESCFLQESHSSYTICWLFLVAWHSRGFLQGIKNSFDDKFNPISKGLTENKTLIEQKAQNIQTAHEKLVNTFNL